MAYVEELYDSLLNEDSPFPEERDLWEEEGQPFYAVSKASVRLEAKLPTLSRPNGSCRIVFRSLRARNTRIALDHAHIVHRLLRGLYSDPVHGLRGFMGEEPRGDGSCLVVLGNSRVPLRAQELKELCEIVDDFGTEFLQCLRGIDDLARSHEFSRSLERVGGYRLVIVKRNVWEHMVQFAIEHDADRGRSPWHMFDRNAFYIKVFHTSKTDRYDDDYHMFFRPERASDLYPWADEVWVVAEVLTDPFSKQPATLGPRRYWDVPTGYQWLTEEFIPKVVSHYRLVPPRKPALPRWVTEFYRGTAGHRHRETKSEHPFYEDGREPVCPSPGSVATLGLLQEYVEHLQLGFHRQGMVVLSTEEVRHIFSAVALCLRRTESVDWPYVRGKLPFDAGRSPADILSTVDRHAREGKGTVHRNLDVDCTLRCIVIALRDGRPKLDVAEIQQVAQWLLSFYDRVERERLLDRACPEQPADLDDWDEMGRDDEDKDSQL